MIINLSPQQRSDHLVLERQGDNLIFNGQATHLPDLVGDDEHGHPWIAGPVQILEGIISLTVILPHTVLTRVADAGLDATLHPAPIEVTEDGVISLPEYGA